MKVGGTYEYTRPPYKLNGKVIPESSVRYVVESYEFRPGRFGLYNVQYENGGRNMVTEGSEMHWDSVEVAS